MQCIDSIDRSLAFRGRALSVGSPVLARPFSAGSRGIASPGPVRPCGGPTTLADFGRGHAGVHACSVGRLRDCRFRRDGARGDRGAAGDVSGGPPPALAIYVR